MLALRRPQRIWPSAWRRHPLAIGATVLVLAAAVGARLRASQPTDYERYHDRLFNCVQGVDGDTIDIDVADGHWQHTRVRLLGTDTPETGKSDVGAMYYGEQASAFTKNLVEHHRVRVLLSPLRSRDIYGRLLAYVYVDDGHGDVMLNEEIISRGFGYADRRFEHLWRLRFEQLEERARKSSSGLWAKVQPAQMPAWRQRYLERTHREPLDPAD